MAVGRRQRESLSACAARSPASRFGACFRASYSTFSVVLNITGVAMLARKGGGADSKSVGRAAAAGGRGERSGREAGGKWQGGGAHECTA